MRGTQGTQEMGGGTSMALPRSRSIASSSLHTLFAAVCIFISYVLNCSGRTELQDLLWANPVGDCMASRRPVPDSPRATVVDEILPTQPFLGERSRGTYTIVEHLPEWRDRRQIFIALFLFEKNFELGSLISDSIQLVKARQNAGSTQSSVSSCSPRCEDAWLAQQICVNIGSRDHMETIPVDLREKRENMHMRTSENHLGGEVVGHRDRAWTDGTEGAKLVMRGIDGLGCSIAGLRMDRWDGGR
ncbi:hypothetical protein C8R43DRAFT_954154 [Mycena crocata]|nr:hypothetical protein C8R43DRAFT_954154 [Mycena crocata]